ncbi:MAG: SPOR domain-containing protein [Burkholderiales bacterium]
MAQEQQDVKTLKRRGRRRLIGAVALVLLAVIVLPMVFDPEPKSTLAPVSVQIPPVQSAPAFAPKPPKPTPAKPQSATTLGDEYVIQVGAFLNPDSVLAKLARAKLPYYTEPAQGKLTRVRAGPFASREAADLAVAKLKELGLNPGAVTAKSG